MEQADGPLQTIDAKTQGDDRAALETFVIDNRELDRLEALLANFNIFEALGVIRQELRHSDFLAFLLDPKQNHGLGDTLLRRLLQKAVQAFPSSTLSVIDLDVWSLADAQVQREWQNIDIFIHDPAHRLAVVVENKIDSGEHSDQLARYWERVKLHYPDTARLVGILLTPEGVEASMSAYSSVSYSTVCQLVEDLIDSRGPSLTEDMRTLFRHYTQMLRRHIVSDSEIADLCRRIYQKHQRALDLIFEHRPDQLAAIRDALAAMIQRTDGVLLDRAAKTMVNFLPVEWDVPELRGGSGWTSSGRILMFEFENEPRRLRLMLWLGPGPEEIRSRMFERAQRAPFRPAGGKLRQRFKTLWQTAILQPSAYESEDMADVLAEIEKQWAHFLGHDLPLLRDAVTSELRAASEVARPGTN